MIELATEHIPVLAGIAAVIQIAPIFKQSLAVRFER